MRVGLTTQIRELSKKVEGTDLRVGEAMTAPVTIEGMAWVNETVAIMRSRGISCLVVDRREDDEHGLLLISDIARVDMDQATGQCHGRRSMSDAEEPAPTVHSDMKLKYAIRYMTRFDLSHRVVLRGLDLAGTATLRDIAIRLLDASDRTEAQTFCAMPRTSDRARIGFFGCPRDAASYFIVAGISAPSISWIL